MFAASIRRGVGEFAAADRVALGVAVAGTAVSVVMARPLLAVLGVVVAELGAVGLTVRKSLADPGSETRSTWIIDGLAGLLSIVALDHMTATTLLYPVHHAAANGAVAIAIAIGRRRSGQIRVTTTLPRARPSPTWARAAGHVVEAERAVDADVDRSGDAQVGEGGGPLSECSTPPCSRTYP